MSRYRLMNFNPREKTTVEGWPIVWAILIALVMIWTGPL